MQTRTELRELQWARRPYLFKARPRDDRGAKAPALWVFPPGRRGRVISHSPPCAEGAGLKHIQTQATTRPTVPGFCDSLATPDHADHTAHASPTASPTGLAPHFLPLLPPCTGPRGHLSLTSPTGSRAQRAQVQALAACPGGGLWSQGLSGPPKPPSSPSPSTTGGWGSWGPRGVSCAPGCPGVRPLCPEGGLCIIPVRRELELLPRGGGGPDPVQRGPKTTHPSSCLLAPHIPAHLS